MKAFTISKKVMDEHGRWDVEYYAKLIEKGELTVVNMEVVDLKHLSLDEARAVFERIKPYPEKPKRIWVSVLRGKATKKGAQWIEDCQEWNLRFLEWYTEKVVEPKIKKAKEEKGENVEANVE
jgi:hypothetical protein